ncbi:MAG: OsmC family protein [Anaerolineaceae bacterium]
MGKKEVSVRFDDDSRKIEVNLHPFTIITDGGDRTDPPPGNYFLAGVLACTASTARAYCLRNNLPAPTGMTATVNVDDDTYLISRIDMQLTLPPDFPPEYREAVERAAGKCTIKKWWVNPPEFNVQAQTQS